MANACLTFRCVSLQFTIKQTLLHCCGIIVIIAFKIGTRNKKRKFVKLILHQLASLSVSHDIELFLIDTYIAWKWHYNDILCQISIEKMQFLQKGQGNIVHNNLVEKRRLVQCILCRMSGNDVSRVGGLEGLTTKH